MYSHWKTQAEQEQQMIPIDGQSKMYRIRQRLSLPRAVMMWQVTMWRLMDRQQHWTWRSIPSDHRNRHWWKRNYPYQVDIWWWWKERRWNSQDTYSKTYSRNLYSFWDSSSGWIQHRRKHHVHDWQKRQRNKRNNRCSYRQQSYRRDSKWK